MLVHMLLVVQPHVPHVLLENMRMNNKCLHVYLVLGGNGKIKQGNNGVNRVMQDINVLPVRRNKLNAYPLIGNLILEKQIANIAVVNAELIM